MSTITCPALPRFLQPRFLWGNVDRFLGLGRARKYRLSLLSLPLLSRDPKQRHFAFLTAFSSILCASVILPPAFCMITRIILLCACFDILFDSSVSVCYFGYSFFVSSFPLCIKKRQVGSLLCFFFYVIVRIICHEDWSASRHVEDMNLDVECPLRLRFFCRADGKAGKQALTGWIRSQILFPDFPFEPFPTGTGYRTGRPSSFEGWRINARDGLLFFPSVMFGWSTLFGQIWSEEV
jgi:hypothetical protein